MEEAVTHGIDEEARAKAQGKTLWVPPYIKPDGTKTAGYWRKPGRVTKAKKLPPLVLTNGTTLNERASNRNAKIDAAVIEEQGRLIENQRNRIAQLEQDGRAEYVARIGELRRELEASQDQAGQFAEQVAQRDKLITDLRQKLDYQTNEVKNLQTIVHVLRELIRDGLRG